MTTRQHVGVLRSNPSQKREGLDAPELLSIREVR